MIIFNWLIVKTISSDAFYIFPATKGREKTLSEEWSLQTSLWDLRDALSCFGLEAHRATSPSTEIQRSWQHLAILQDINWQIFAIQ